MIKIKDYLFVPDTFDFLDYDAATLHFKEKYQEAPGGCSVAQSGSIVGRNFDYFYDEHPNVIIKTKAYASRYATIGVAKTSGNITNKALTDGNYKPEDLEMLPFAVSDCMNSEGLYASINLVPFEDGEDTTPIGTTGPEVCQIMLPRYLCDFAKTVDEAIELLDNCIVYAPLGISMKCHLYVTDGTDAVVVEFLDDNLAIVEDQPIITNFYVSDWTGDIASVALGDSEDDVAATGLTDHSNGLERYLILADGLDDVTDTDDMLDLMKEVRYSEAYKTNVNPVWYSEFYEGDLDIYSSAQDLVPALEQARTAFQNRTRNGKVWITSHTSVYDLTNKKLIVVSEEAFDDSYEFELDLSKPYGIQRISKLFAPARRPK